MVAETLTIRPADVGGGRVRYTIASLVTEPAQHAELRASFEAGGFRSPDCEYTIIDNSHGNVGCAYRGLNRLLAEARGAYVVLCHQDVRLLADGRERLDTLLAELETRDPDWAVAGNAGGYGIGSLAIRISDPHGADQRVGTLPARVRTLDENFIIVRRSARTGFSNDLTGFHFYGADICLAADVMGYSSYVIDFHLQHLSPGRKDVSFYEAERRFVAKWGHALRPRWMQTTCSLVHVSGSRLGDFIANLASRPLAGLMRRLPIRTIWTGNWPLGEARTGRVPR